MVSSFQRNFRLSFLVLIGAGLLTSACTIRIRTPLRIFASATTALFEFDSGSGAFAITEVGNTSAAITFTGTNHESSDIVISQSPSTGSTEFTITGGDCFDTLPKIIPVGGTCTVEVVFNPTSGGTKSATLSQTYTVRGGARTATQTLAAIPLATITSFSPSTTAVGGLVTLVGTNLTGITDVSVNGTSVATFTVVSDSEVTFMVPVGATTGTVAITTAESTVVTSADPLTITTVAVLTIGGNPYLGSTVRGATGAFDFSIVNIGGLQAQNLSVTTAPSSPFAWTTGTYPGTGVGTRCGTTLAGATACDLSLSFTPTAIRPYGAIIEIEYFDGVQTQTLPLNLRADGIALQLSRESWDFGTVRTGGTEYAVMRIHNQGNGEVSLSGAVTGATAFRFAGGTYPGTGGPGFTYSPESCSSSLRSQHSCDVIVAYSPTTPGLSQTGTLQFSTPLDTLSVSLTGASKTPPSCSCDPTPRSFFGNANSNGSIDRPWQICSRAHLESIDADLTSNNGWIRNYFLQCADIDLGGASTPMDPIGSRDVDIFMGNYDGNHYQISNFYQSDNFAYMGLFSSIQNATLKNIHLFDATIAGTTEAGGITGGNLGNSTLQNLWVTGNISGTDNVGGILGASENGPFTMSHVQFLGAVSGSSSTGGLMGNLRYGTIVDSSVMGQVALTGDVGGSAVGNCNNCGTSNVSVSGTLDGRDYVGGAAGATTNGDFASLRSTLAVAGTASVGGLLGYAQDSKIHQSGHWGSVTGGDTGGAFGVFSGSDAQNIETEGAVTGASTAGGIAGVHQGIASLRLNRSNARVFSGTGAPLGGLVGQVLSNSSITDSYSEGTIYDGSAIAGGLAGRACDGIFTRNYSALTSIIQAGTQPVIGFEDCANTYTANHYWATGSSRGLTPIIGPDPSVAGISAQSATLLQTIGTFAGFDFSALWQMSSSLFLFPGHQATGPGIGALVPSVVAINDTLIIHGVHFTGTTSVILAGGILPSFTVIDDEHLSVTIPATATDGAVSVVTPYGTATSASTLTIMPAIPVITSLSSVSIVEGDTIVITGQDFSDVIGITIGGMRVGTFTIDSSTQITMTVPTGTLTGTLQLVTSTGAVVTYGTPITIINRAVLAFTSEPFLGTVVQGGYLPDFTLTLTNSGLSTATAISVTTPPSGDFSWSTGSYPGTAAGNSCGTSLAAGASCQLSIRMNPSAQGIRGTSLTLSYNDAVQVQSLSESLSARSGQLRILGGVQALGKVRPGSPVYLVYRIFNPGINAISASISITGENEFIFPGGFPGTGISDTALYSHLSECVPTASTTTTGTFGVPGGANGGGCDIVVQYVADGIGSGAQSATLTLTPLSGPTDSLVLNGFSETSALSCVCDPTDHTYFGNAASTGTIGSPYLVCSRAHLERIASDAAANSDWSGLYFRQCSSIDLSGSNWTPIPDFSGTYQGNDLEIQNMTINLPAADEVGFFGDARFGSISNVRITRATVTGRNFVGALAGIAGRVDSCSATATVTGTSGVGGLTGASMDSIANLLFVGSVSGTNTVGGIVGQTNATTNRLLSFGTVTGGTNYTGGVMGQVNCYTHERAFSAAAVSGSQLVGGVAGDMSVCAPASQTTGTSWTSAATVTGNSVAFAEGGVVGRVSGSALSSSQNYGSVSGGGYAGGVVGVGDGNSSLSSLENQGRVNGALYSAGIVGFLVATTLNTSINYGAIGVVTGSGAGGISGYMDRGSIFRVSNFGAVGTRGGSGPTGGLVGDVSGNGSSQIQESFSAAPFVSRAPLVGFGADATTFTGNNTYFWKSGTINGVTPNVLGVGGDPFTAGTLGLTGAQMQDSSNFMGWSFVIGWEMNTVDLLFPKTR